MNRTKFLPIPYPRCGSLALTNTLQEVEVQGSESVSSTLAR